MPTKKRKANVHMIKGNATERAEQTTEKIETLFDLEDRHSRAMGFTDLLTRILADVPHSELIFTASEQFGLYSMLDIVRNDLDFIYLDGLTEEQRKSEMEYREKLNA